MKMLFYWIFKLTAQSAEFVADRYTLILSHVTGRMQDMFHVYLNGVKCLQWHILLSAFLV